MSAEEFQFYLQTIDTGLSSRTKSSRQHQLSPSPSLEEGKSWDRTPDLPDAQFEQQSPLPSSGRSRSKLVGEGVASTPSSPASSRSSSISRRSDSSYELILSLHLLLHTFRTHLIALIDTFGPDSFPNILGIARDFDALLDQSQDTDDFTALEKIKDRAFALLLLTRANLHLDDNAQDRTTNAATTAAAWDRSLDATLRAHHALMTTLFPEQLDPSLETITTAFFHIAGSRARPTYGWMAWLQSWNREVEGKDDESLRGKCKKEERGGDVGIPDATMRAGKEEVVEWAEEDVIVALEKTNAFREWVVRELVRDGAEIWGDSQ